MSSSNCCFLTCIQISQEAGQVVWYSHLFQDFPQFIVIHTVKGFGIVNKAEIDVFLELSCFFDDPADLGIWSLVPLPFLKPAWTWGNPQFTYCWSLAWRILSITLLAREMSAIVRWFEHSLALPFFGIGMKTDLFQSCGHFWVFQICWHIECSTFTASSFRIWNSSTGVPSPPLALFIVMLSKAHLSSHSRMSGSRSVITPLWLSGLWRSILYSSSVYSFHLFLISSAQNTPMILRCTWGKSLCFLSGFQAKNNLAPPAIFLCDHISCYFSLGWFPSTVSASLVSSCEPAVLPLQGSDLIWPLYLESSSHSNCMVYFFIFCRPLLKHQPLMRSFLATLSQMTTLSLNCFPFLMFFINVFLS